MLWFLTRNRENKVRRLSITSTLVRRADLRFIEAAEALRPYVGCFWVVTAKRDATIRTVPDSSTAISIQLQRTGTSGWVLRGPMVRPEERRFRLPAILIGVRLRPGVAFLVSGIAAHTIVGRHVRLSGTAACHALAGEEPLSRTPAQYIDILQSFLVERLTNANVHLVVAKAIDEIQQAHGAVRIAEVAARCGVSSRHLNRLMHVWVGYGPKCFGRIVRFQETLKQIEHSPSRSAAALASETGYFDQAHLTLDLTHFAGATPGHLVSRCVADFSKTRCDELL